MAYREQLLTVPSVLDEFGNKYEGEEKIVFWEQDVRWTADYFVTKLNKMANAYLDIGLEKGSRIGLMGVNTPELVVSYYAAMKAGLFPALFVPREADGRLQKLGKQFNPDAVAFDPNFYDKMENVITAAGSDITISFQDSRNGIFSYADLQSSYPSTSPGTSITRDEPCLLSWSSGTTGLPKGLVWSHEGILFALQISAAKGGMSPDDVLPNVFTPGFQGWLYQSLPALYAGTKLSFLREFDPKKYLAMIDDEEVTCFTGVPTQMKMVLDENLSKYDLSSIERGWYGGEKMNVELIERIQNEITEQFSPTYATTEVTGTSGITAQNHGEKPNAIGSGPPLVEIRAVELRQEKAAPPDAEIEPGEQGELIIRSPARAEYILDNPEKTDEIFRDGWWYSGDIVYKDSDGDLFVEGRKDSMIISGGINISPSAVEPILTDHEVVEQAIVAGVPDEQWGEKVTAFIQTNRNIAPEELEQYCREHPNLPRHARPRDFVFVSDEFPKTPTGKIDRQKLVDKYLRE